MRSEMSMNVAVAPPTNARAPGTPDDATTPGSSARNRDTSAAVAALSGDVVGKTVTSATVLRGLNCGGSAAATPSVLAAAAATASATTSKPSPVGVDTATRSGP